MHPPDEFLRHADCEMMAKFIRDAQSSATWRGWRKGGVVALNWPNVKAQRSAL